MSYLVLARKYRPQTFDQVVSQVHVTQTLSNAIASNRVAHAILFSGPRGTGKTTVARILAKAMNCKQGPRPEPCNKCRACREITSGSSVDVFEIDGASNNGVEQIRELRENVKYMPARSTFKIYIIDEVHMLSTPAFNALLKTLEEPPAHVMFFFATTEPQKIPITILSRCQRYDFRRIDLEAIVTHLQSLCRQEGIEIALESLTLIAREAGGSMRDALSLLDQVFTGTQEPLDHQQVLDILGVIDRQVMFALSEAILAGNIADLLAIIDDVYRQGIDLKILYADLIEHFRNLTVARIGPKAVKLIDLPEHEIDSLRTQVKAFAGHHLNTILNTLLASESRVRFAAYPRVAIEMILIDIIQIKPALPIGDLITQLDKLRGELLGTGGHRCSEDGAMYEMAVPAQSPTAQPTGPNVLKPDAGGATPTVTAGAPDDDMDRTWGRLLDMIAEKNPSLASNLAQSGLKRVTASEIEIEVNGSEFNINRVKRRENLQLITTVCRSFFGRELALTITPRRTGAKSKAKKKQRNRIKQDALNHPLIGQAIEVFNGKLIDVKLL